MNTSRKLKVVAVCGSIRPNNYTSKALALVIDEFVRMEDIDAELIDPSKLHLPLPGLGAGSPDVKWLRERMNGADGIVMSTPEYNGGMSSVIKLVIENLGYPSGLSCKPVAILGVAAGAIGAIKATEQLRSVCSHVGALVLPGTVSVAFVNKVFDEQGQCLDASVDKRVRGVATILADYLRRTACPSKSVEQVVRETAKT